MSDDILVVFLMDCLCNGNVIKHLIIGHVFQAIAALNKSLNMI